MSQFIAHWLDFILLGVAAFWNSPKFEINWKEISSGFMALVWPTLFDFYHEIFSFFDV